MGVRTVYVDGTTSGTDHFATVIAWRTWQNGNYPDLTANNGSGSAGPVHVEISITSEETSQIYLTGFTTDASNYIYLYTTGSARHAGVWSTGCHRIYSNNSSSASTIVAETGFIRLDGLQLGCSDSHNDARIIDIGGIPTPNDVRISNCILQASGGAYHDSGILVGGTTATVKIWNCLLYGFGSGSFSAGIESVASGGTAYVYNCTVIGGYYGVYGTVFTAKNTYAHGTDPWNGATTSYCASSAAGELSGTGDVNSAAYSTATFVSVTPGNADYLKPVTAGPLVAAGNAPGGSAPLDYTVDIAGDTVSTWDIGAFNFADVASQYARPASDVADGNWLNESSSNTNLYASIDEASYSDSDYITSGAAPSSDTVTIGLSSIAAPDSGTVTLRVRAKYV